MINNSKTKFPASHKLAVEKKSFVKERRLMQRCKVQMNNNERELITNVHWKPISKIIT